MQRKVFRSVSLPNNGSSTRDLGKKGIESNWAASKNS